MFDDENQNLGAPDNLPAEPADIFAGVDKEPSQASPNALSAGLLKKKEDSGSGQNLSPTSHSINLEESDMRPPVLGKVVFFLIIILLLGGLAYGGWVVFYRGKNMPLAKPVAAPVAPQTNVNNQPPVATPATTSQNTISATSSNISNQINNDQILFGQTIDRDKDGLDETREKELGTDPQKPDTDNDGLNDGDEVIVFKTNPLVADTDGDGLSDGDEVLIWHTNPLNADTDGDSYKDGEEVKNGYSPLGPGKLFSSPTSTPAGTTSTPKK